MIFFFFLRMLRRRKEKKRGNYFGMILYERELSFGGWGFFFFFGSYARKLDLISASTQ